MSDPTRVPLKPINRNSLLMLVLGIVIGLAIAGAFAWFTAPKGVKVHEVTAGSGAHPKPDDVVFVRYTGKLENGTVFDKSQDLQVPVPGILPAGYPLPLANMLPGFKEAVVKMQKGGKYEITIPAEKAYGASPPPGSPIPPNANLKFDIELIDFMSTAEADRRVQVLQQMMQRAAQQQQQGAPPAADGGKAPAPQTGQAPAPQAAQ
jgi:FKBP-type peptidyl-prolyl cis-trans isomerase FkpA